MSGPRQLTLFLVATQFLTRLPTPPVAGFQPSWLGRSLRYFPLVGGFVGLVNVAVWELGVRVFPVGVAVGLMLAVSLLVTGAFHEDGFADSCDGFGGARTRDRVLAIMKDSRIGAFGAIGIFMLLGLKWLTITNLPAASVPLVIVSAHIVSRWSAIGLVWRLRYARDDDAGKSHAFDAGLTTGEWLAAGALGALFIALVCRFTGISHTELIAVSAAVAAAMAITVAFGVYVHARIGGYTGDCLGATQQLSELAFMLVALAVLPRAVHPA
jgi:adenosylcobinamide-GDP ribazoletransferase